MTHDSGRRPPNRGVSAPRSGRSAPRSWRRLDAAVARHGAHCGANVYDPTDRSMTNDPNSSGTYMRLHGAYIAAEVQQNLRNSVDASFQTTTCHVKTTKAA